jgi:hypothetical protein
MKWTYDEFLTIYGWWEVFENDRRLFCVYTECYNFPYPGPLSRFVSTGPFQDSKVSLNPFSLSIPHPNPLPVFVYQEIPL